MLNAINNNLSSNFDTVEKSQKVSESQKIEPQEKQKEMSKDDTISMKKIIDMFNEMPGNKLKFGFNDEFGMGTVNVYERDSDRLIREFPSKEFFSRMEFFRDNILPGLLMDTSV